MNTLTFQVSNEVYEACSLRSPTPSAYGTRHFRRSEDGTEIIGLTACGRATVEALKLNNEHVKQTRARFSNAYIHSPKD